MCKASIAFENQLMKSINKQAINEKSHAHINIEKAFDKIPHILMIKNVNKVGIERNFLKFIKNSYKTPQLTS